MHCWYLIFVNILVLSVPGVCSHKMKVCFMSASVLNHLPARRFSRSPKNRSQCAVARDCVHNIPDVAL
jgi:hypothetical protein